MGPTCKKKHEAEQVEIEFKKNQITMDEVFEESQAS